METPTKKSAAHYVLEDVQISSMVFKAATVILLASLVHKAIFMRKAYRVFPVWATIEIALAGFIIPSGLPLHILYVTVPSSF